MNADFVALQVSSQFVSPTLTQMFQDLSPEEGSGAARAATERARIDISVSPRNSVGVGVVLGYKRNL
jgi:hypothetical protein